MTVIMDFTKTYSLAIFLIFYLDLVILSKSFGEAFAVALVT